MTTTNSRIDWLLFVLVAGMWGSSYLFIKIGVETLPPFTLVALRLAFGLALLATIVLVAREPLPRDRRTYGHPFVLGVLNIVIPFSLITWGEQSIDSALASVLNGTVPLFTIVIAALALHDEPITVNRLVGLAIGFAGVVVLTSRNLGAGSSQLEGEIALVGSSIAYALGNVYARRNVRGLRPMIPAMFQVGFAFVVSALLALAFENPLSITLRPDALFAVIWLGLLGSGSAYLIFFRLLARWGSTRSSLVAYLLPVFGILLGFLVLNEQIDERILFGTAMIIGGVALVNSRFGARRLFGRRPAVPASVSQTRAG